MKRKHQLEKVRPLITFDIVLKKKVCLSCTDEFSEKLNKYLNDIGIKNRGKAEFIRKYILRKMRGISGIKNFDELIKESGLNEHEFMTRLIEVLERMGLDISKNKLSPFIVDSLNREIDRYYGK